MQVFHSHQSDEWRHEQVNALTAAIQDNGEFSKWRWDIVDAPNFHGNQPPGRVPQYAGPKETSPPTAHPEGGGYTITCTIYRDQHDICRNSCSLLTLMRALYCPMPSARVCSAVWSAACTSHPVRARGCWRIRGSFTLRLQGLIF